VKEALTRIFLVNPALKSFSVVVAVALFFLVRADRIKELEVEVPVAVGDVRENVVLTGDVPSSVRVRIRGRWSRLLRVLETRPSPYEIKMSELHQGQTYVFDERRISSVIGVAGLSVVGVDPPGIAVNLEPRVSKRVRVELDVSGEPAEGWLVDIRQIRFQPQEVEVRGAKSSVDAVEIVRSAPIDLTGVSRDLRIDVPLRRPDLPFTTLGEDRVSVQIPVTEAQIEDTLLAVPIEVRNCNPFMRCAVAPGKVDIQVHGPFRRVRDLRELAGEELVFVDAFQESQKAGSYAGVVVRARRTEGVVMKLDPPEVALTVQAVVLPPQPEPPPEGGADAGAGEGGEEPPLPSPPE
jgi:YbbR domain-containing protein